MKTIVLDEWRWKKIQGIMDEQGFKTVDEFIDYVLTMDYVMKMVKGVQWRNGILEIKEVK